MLFQHSRHCKFVEVALFEPLVEIQSQNTDRDNGHRKQSQKLLPRNYPEEYRVLHRCRLRRSVIDGNDGLELPESLHCTPDASKLRGLFWRDTFAVFVDIHGRNFLAAAIVYANIAAGLKHLIAVIHYL